MAEACLEEIQDFLAQKRIAVVGASRNPKDFNSAVFREFRQRGYEAVPVNPHTGEIEGTRCYDSVGEIAPPVDAALLLTKPEVTETVVNDCARAGIGRVWMYRADPASIEFCRRKGIRVIAGYCPFMFLPKAAWVHRMHGFVMKITRAYPR